MRHFNIIDFGVQRINMNFYSTYKVEIGDEEHPIFKYVTLYANQEGEWTAERFITELEINLKIFYEAYKKDEFLPLTDSEKLNIMFSFDEMMEKIYKKTSLASIINNMITFCYYDD